MNIEISPKECERTLNWHDAMLYCQLLTIGGKNDWRLPTKDELNEIYKAENDLDGLFYWSSTEHNGDNAWYKNMSSGNQYHYDKNSRFNVRVVRSFNHLTVKNYEY